MPSVGMEKREQLNWLLDDFIIKTPGVSAVLLATTDGMKLATANFSDDDAEKFAAITTAQHSLAEGAGQLLGGRGLRHILLGFETGVHLIVMAAGHGALLMGATKAETDVGQAAFAMEHLVKGVGRCLSVEDRTAPATTGAPGQ